MSDEFTKEQMESAYMAGQVAARDYPLHINAQKYVDDIIAELTKPEWKPPDTQVLRYKFDGGGIDFNFYREGHELSRCRPLTTKEAGPECMQHLLDDIERISKATGCSWGWYASELQKSLDRHKELMK